MKSILCFRFYIYLIISGHLVQEVPEFPLVVSDKIQEYTKTKQATIFLHRIKAWKDVQKVLINIILLVNLV